MNAYVAPSSRAHSAQPQQSSPFLRHTRLALLVGSLLVGTAAWAAGQHGPSASMNGARANASQQTQQAAMDTLDFSRLTPVSGSTRVNGKAVAYRSYENVVYVRNPVDAEYQSLNIYVPEAYFQGGTIHGYTARTAPIFLPNQVGGYMPAKPGVVGQAGFGPRDPDQADAMQTALARGLVVVSPGARGRTQATGKAPAAIVDLKAAVRYLKHNDAAMPGDANRIISNGTSAGGALSVLLGASANQPDYEPYLKALGAADAPDDIFAVSAYCPISILEQADAAYEWEFNGVDDYAKIDMRQIDFHVERKLVKGVLTSEQKKVSSQLKPLFTEYVNALHLLGPDGRKLSLDAQGNGSFKAHVASYLAASAQKQLDAGKDLSDRDWLTLQDGQVKAVDFAAFARAAGRQKTPPAFDGLALDSGENQEFGTDTVDARHFTAYSAAHSTVRGASVADAQTIRLMNPMNYIAHRQAGPQHWRIRVGTADRDTSHAIAVILATRLQNTGKQVDLFMPWDVPHSGDYDLDELFGWIDRTVAAGKGGR